MDVHAGWTNGATKWNSSVVIEVGEMNLQIKLVGAPEGDKLKLVLEYAGWSQNFLQFKHAFF